MCMSCESRKITKKKIAIFSSIGVGITALTYIAFITTNNPVLAAAMPAVLGFAACPAICITMGGAMWFMNRLSKNKNKNRSNNHTVNLEEEMSPPCSASHKEAKQLKLTDIEMSQTSGTDNKSSR